MNKIPVTILVGFLGAGKTTLLNHIIASNPDENIVVIENEFGEIGIDKGLVVGVDNKVFELNNGCICCNLNDDLLDLLSQIVEKNVAMSHLIIETTGMADPGSVILNFLHNESIQSQFKLNAVIALVDAQFVEQQLENQIEAVKQISLADIILINKIDNVEPYQIDVVKNIVTRLNAQAQIFETNFGKLKDVDLLNLNTFDADIVNETLNKKVVPNSRFVVSKTSLGEKPQASMLLPKTVKHSNVTSFSFIIPEPLDFMKFEMWVNLIFNLYPNQIYRMKGVLNFQHFEQKVIFQSVYNQQFSTQGDLWADTEARESRLVIIGNSLNKQMFLDCIEQLIVVE